MTDEVNEELSLETRLMHLLVANLQGHSVDMLSLIDGKLVGPRELGVSVGGGRSIRMSAIIDMVRQHDAIAYGSYFQTCARGWSYACFPAEVVENIEERGDRFVEEALELAQAVEGYGAERAHALVDYVFGRPVGYAPQEVGGVMVTLNVLCSVLGINVDDAAWDELNRIRTPEMMEKIRRKQAAKPTGSALPQ